MMKKVFELERVNHINLNDVSKAYNDFLREWKRCDIVSESDKSSKDYDHIVIDGLGRLWYHKVRYEYNSEGGYTDRKDDKILYRANVTEVSYKLFIKAIALNYYIIGKHHHLDILKKTYPEIDFETLLKRNP